MKNPSDKSFVEDLENYYDDLYFEKKYFKNIDLVNKNTEVSNSGKVHQISTESCKELIVALEDLFDGLSAEDIQYITGIPEQRCVEILLIVQDAINDFKRKVIS